jgi:hypothetical protein
MARMVVVGGIYSPNHYSSRCYRRAYPTVWWCTGHATVHCPVRATSADHWGFERLTVEVLCPLVTPDSPVAHQTVWCTLTSQFWLMTCALFTVHLMSQSTVGRSWPLLHWLTGQSGAHQTVRWIIAEWLWENPKSDQFLGCLGLGTGQCLVHTGQCLMRHWQHQCLSLLQTL